MASTGTASYADTLLGLDATFQDTLARTNEELAQSWLGKIVHFTTSDTEYNEYGYLGALPVMSPQQAGNAVNTTTIGSTGYTVYNEDFSRRLEWKKNRRMDGKLQDLYAYASGLAATAGLAKLFVVYDYLMGTTANSHYVSTAPDGAAVFSTSTRFGVSGGNVEGSVSFATPAGLRAGIWGGIKRAHKFVDEQGIEIHSEGAIKNEVVVLYGADDMEMVSRAFHSDLTAIAASTATSNAAVSNSLSTQVAGTNFTFVNAQTRIPTGTIILAIPGARVKPFVWQDREAAVVSESLHGSATAQESTQTFGTEYAQAEMRGNLGANLPYSLVKVTSA